MNTLTFVLGVLSSFLAAGIMKLLSVTVSFIPSKYPDLRGAWCGNYVDADGSSIKEEIIVQRQLFKKIKGTFTSSSRPSTTSDPFKYRFTGYFVSPNLISLSFRPANRKFTDFGVAIFKIDNDHRRFSGASASICIKTGDPYAQEYTAYKK